MNWEYIFNDKDHPTVDQDGATVEVNQWRVRSLEENGDPWVGNWYDGDYPSNYEMSYYVAKKKNMKIKPAPKMWVEFRTIIVQKTIINKRRQQAPAQYIEDLRELARAESGKRDH